MSTEDEVVVRFKVKDKAAFIADLKAGKLAVDDMNKSIVKADAESKLKAGEMGGFSLLGKSARLAALAVGGVTLALGAATVGVAAYGIKSASSLEQATIAYTTLLGSQAKAKDLLDRLGKFAAQTPFQLENLRQTGSAMLGAGFSANEIIPDLTAVGDAMSGLGRGQGDIDGVTQAFEKMRASVHLNAREMNELTIRGINGWQILADKSGKSVEDVQKATSHRQIGSIAAIKALVDGMEFGTKHTMKFGGLMEKQSASLSGMWSNTIDAIQQTTAKLMLPTFPVWKKWIAGFNNAMPAISANLSAFGPRIFNDLRSGGTKGGFGLAMDVGAMLGGNFTLTPLIEKAVVTVQNLVTIWRGALWPAIKDTAAAFKPFGLLLTNADTITGYLAAHTSQLHTALVALVITVGTYKTLVFAINGYLKTAAFLQGLYNVTVNGGTAATNAQRVAMVLWKGVMLAVRAATLLWTAAQWLLNAAWDANPIGVVILLVAGLVAGVIWAYKNVGWFRDGVNWLWDKMKTVFSWVKDHWMILLPIILGPFGALIDLVVANWGTISGALIGVYNWAMSHWRDLVAVLLAPFTPLLDAIHATIDAWNTLTGMNDPGSGSYTPPAGGANGGTAVRPGPLIMPGGMADGGRVQQSGWSRVGERGPELMHVPRGAQVIPLPRVPELAGGRDSGDIVVQIDGREVFRAVRRHEDHALARL